jgi:site-specific DNA-methyltransferase (adenine-specific)
MIELNRIYFEDCYDTLVKMDDGCVDLMLQDTPFEVTQNEWDIAPDFEKMWPEWLRVGKENCAYLFFGTQPFVSDLINSNRKMFRYDLIWYKALGTGFLNANKMPMRNHEHIIVFYRKLPTYNPQKRIGEYKTKRGMGKQSTNYNGAERLPTVVNNTFHPQSVIDFTNGDRTIENSHPTQKPIDVIRYLIKTYSNENELVFDGYMGSGTTAAACVEEKRNFIGSENKKDYHDLSTKRYNNAIKQTKLF